MVGSFLGGVFDGCESSVRYVSLSSAFSNLVSFKWTC